MICTALESPIRRVTEISWDKRMILYGRDMSPFARRVAIWCALQDRPIERRQLLVSGPEWDEIKKVNPMGRVPALVLDDGDVLVETSAIFDYLEETAPEGKNLIPAAGLERRKALQDMAYATATAEKIVALVYDKVRRPESYHYPAWIERLEGQIISGLVEMDGRVPAEGWMSGQDGPGGADIATICAFEMAAIVFPDLDAGPLPGLMRLTIAAQAIACFPETRPNP
ncbi:Glutathione S-transferase GST-6.0 [Pontivivens insulae]|uniref:Glutathione S-transferase GST-6.0 n=2 Tax=Pontivivens insulae TaxID=1639689 RepID=A0A2R8ACD9_9RHOB|nr:glutathione S-transferase [Pontivivens insulae]SPF29887.1 Glutathione S-transferase GST-6.0 [Pontivivens insulae]